MVAQERFQQEAVSNLLAIIEKKNYLKVIKNICNHPTKLGFHVKTNHTSAKNESLGTSIFLKLAQTKHEN